MSNSINKITLKLNKKTDLAFKIGIDYSIKYFAPDYIVKSINPDKKIIDRIIDFYSKGCKSVIVGSGFVSNHIIEVKERGFIVQYVREIQSNLIVYPLAAAKLILNNKLIGFDFILI